MSDLKNKVAIVTGSTSGIGASIAHHLSRAGTNVVIHSARSTDKGKDIASKTPGSIYIQGNIALEQDCQQLIRETIRHFGRLDILVNNAGQSMRNTSPSALDVSNEVFSDTLDINVVGTWGLIREAMPHLKKTGDANIINITSCAGIDPASGSSGIPYAVAKSALNHLTKLLAKPCGPEVRVNAIAPGLIMTPRTEHFYEAINLFKTKTPLKRIGKPEDIAELCLAIIKSNYINGEVVVADGGFATS
jgi:ketoreductase RED2